MIKDSIKNCFGQVVKNMNTLYSKHACKLDFTYELLFSTSDKVTVTLFRFAYIEFSDKESVRTSLALDESLFRGRQIKVSPIPSFWFSVNSPG